MQRGWGPVAARRSVFGADRAIRFAAAYGDHRWRVGLEEVLAALCASRVMRSGFSAARTERPRLLFSLTPRGVKWSFGDVAQPRGRPLQRRHRSGALRGGPKHQDDRQLDARCPRIAGPWDHARAGGSTNPRRSSRRRSMGVRAHKPVSRGSRGSSLRAPDAHFPTDRRLVLGRPRRSWLSDASYVTATLGRLAAL